MQVERFKPFKLPRNAPGAFADPLNALDTLSDIQQTILGRHIREIQEGLQVGWTQNMLEEITRDAALALPAMTKQQYSILHRGTLHSIASGIALSTGEHRKHLRELLEAPHKSNLTHIFAKRVLDTPFHQIHTRPSPARVNFRELYIDARPLNIEDAIADDIVRRKIDGHNPLRNIINPTTYSAPRHEINDDTVNPETPVKFKITYRKNMNTFLIENPFLWRSTVTEIPKPSVISKLKKQMTQTANVWALAPDLGKASIPSDAGIGLAKNPNLWSVQDHIDEFRGRRNIPERFGKDNLQWDAFLNLTSSLNLVVGVDHLQAASEVITQTEWQKEIARSEAFRKNPDNAELFRPTLGNIDLSLSDDSDFGNDDDDAQPPIQSNLQPPIQSNLQRPVTGIDDLPTPSPGPVTFHPQPPQALLDTLPDETDAKDERMSNMPAAVVSSLNPSAPTFDPGLGIDSTQLEANLRREQNFNRIRAEQTIHEAQRRGRAHIDRVNPDRMAEARRDAANIRIRQAQADANAQRHAAAVEHVPIPDDFFSPDTRDMLQDVHGGVWDVRRR